MSYSLITRFVVEVKQFNSEALIFFKEVVYCKNLSEIWIEFVPTHF